jgi:hypothetical protein
MSIDEKTLAEWERLTAENADLTRSIDDWAKIAADERAATLAVMVERDAAREALRGLVDTVGRSDEGSAWLDDWGMRFYRETGVWPHFKSAPLDMRVDLDDSPRRWTEWIRAKRDAAIDAARRALGGEEKP